MYVQYGSIHRIDVTTSARRVSECPDRKRAETRTPNSLSKIWLFRATQPLEQILGSEFLV